ncbi:putative lipase [Iris pallida]|uniref:Lipase n=1 Tax=Iris pallida TaxID=29817 RepID=A0AAX6EVZ6_IRIPA|nr:putative lipase [Iris pallida]
MLLLYTYLFLLSLLSLTLIFFPFLFWKLIYLFSSSIPRSSSPNPNSAKTMGNERGGGVRSEGSGNGGVDVWSSDSASSSSADHLVVMVHGILGSTANWKYAANQFVQKLPDKVIVHCSERNMYKLTLDGIEVMGERLAEEVTEVVNRRPEIQRISFVAHSVGGLVARYAIGRLYRAPRQKPEDPFGGASDDSSKGTICGLEAMNFITIASPHLGSRGNGQVPFLFGVPAIEKVASYVSHWIFGRTGTQLFLADVDQGKPPLLLQMVEDCGELHFMSALKAFKRRVAYSNVGYDHIVGWRTSSIRRNSELPKWEGSLNGKYPHVVYEEFSKGSEKSSNVSLEVDNRDMLEEKMLNALTRLSWERVDVSFHNSIQRFDAHNVIQVKDDFIHSEGADVIWHMIDHFIT